MPCFVSHLPNFAHSYSTLDMFSYCKFINYLMRACRVFRYQSIFLTPPSADGIAAACFGSIMNYLLLGLAFEIDQFYLHSFEILLACTVVFPGIGNVGYTLLEYRLGHRKVAGALLENLRWIPFL